MAKFKDLKAMSENELNEKVIEAKQQLAKERASIASGTRSENPGKIKKLRRDIAKMLTALNQKASAKKEVKGKAEKVVQKEKKGRVQ